MGEGAAEGGSRAGNTEKKRRKGSDAVQVHRE